MYPSALKKTQFCYMLCSTEQDKTFWQILTIKWNAHRHGLVKEEEKR